MKITSGVYLLWNIVTGKRYVGSTTGRIENRVNGHFKQLRKGVHRNRHLQAAYTKYGEAVFRWRVLKRCPASECVKTEQYYIDLYRSADPKRGYNICPTAGSTLGIKLTAVQRDRCSVTAKQVHSRPEVKALRKRVRESPEFKKRHAAAMKGVTSNPEYRRNMSVAVKSALADPSVRKRISEGVRWAYASDPTFVERVRAASVGRRHTEESKAKIAAAHARPETKAKLSAALKGRVVSEDARRRIGEAQRNPSPETRARKSAAAKAAWARRKGV